MLGQQLGGGIQQGISSMLEAKVKALQNKPYAQALSQLFGDQGGQQQGGLPTGLNNESTERSSSNNGQAIDLTGLNAQQATELTKLAMKKRAEDQKRQYEEKKIALKEQKKEEAATQKETKEYYYETLKSQRTGQETVQTLDKMEKLIENKKLPPAALYKFVKDIQKDVSISSGAAGGGAIGAAVGSLAGGIGAAPAAIVGAGIGAMISPIASLVESGIKSVYTDTEEFEKLSNSFIRGAKDLFGARITDSDLSAFLATVPTLMQTEHGKRQIINNMRIISQAAEVRGNAMKEIIKENKGKRPGDLAILVEERASKELDDLAYKFVNG